MAAHRWRVASMVVLRLPRRVLAPAGRSWALNLEAQNPTLINRRAPDLAVRLPLIIDRLPYVRGVQS